MYFLCVVVYLLEINFDMFKFLFVGGYVTLVQGYSQ